MTELAEVPSTFSFGEHCPLLGHCGTLRRTRRLSGSSVKPSAAELTAAVLLLGRKYADHTAFTIGVRRAEWAKDASAARVSASMPARMTVAEHVRGVAASLADIAPGPAGTGEPRLALLCVLDGTAESGAAADLIVSAEVDNGGPLLSVDFHAHVHDSVFADRMLGHLANLLRQFTDSPDRALGSVSLLTAPELEQLRMINETSRPQASTIYQLFQAQVATRAECPSVSHESGTITYRELARHAEALARTLSGHGIRRHSRVAFVLGKSPLVVIAMLAIARLGAAYVPIDASWPANRRAQALSDSGSELLLTDVADTSAGVPVLFLDRYADLPSGGAGTTEVTAGGATEDPAGAAPGDTAYIMYTSGSTGTPKGVQISQRAVVRLVRDTDYAELGPQTRILQTGAIAFDATTFEIWGALLNGGTVALTSADTVLDARRLAAAIAKHRVNTMWLTAGLFNQLVEQDPAVFNGCQVLTGGEAASARHLAGAIAACPDSTFANMYGPTENTTFSTAHRVTRLSGGEGAVPIGRPIANSTAYVLDSEGNAQPIGVPGELCVGGAGLSDGYLGRPDLNERAFVHAGPGAERLYRTGDIVRWTEEMTLHFMGRADDQVKIRGFRVELTEVEGFLRRVAGVAEAVALVRRDGNGGTVLCAYFTADRPLSAAELREALQRELPEYMVPARFRQLAEIPLTRNHKIDRKSLAALPETVDADMNPPSREAETPHEKAAVVAFADVLGLPTVSLDDDFFALGGHSLLAMRLWSRVRETVDPRISLDEILANPTAGAVARLADRATVHDGGPDGQTTRLVRPKLLRRPRLGQRDRRVPACA